ncbi:MAG: hypothetical protein IKO04_07450 [Bacteroidales bacterium]|nr:hypothetical protein [Bacteroidales bacterium]
MNLRDIKKDIAYILEAFIEDCTTVATVNSKVDEKAAELFEEAVNLYNELMDKVSAKIEGSKKAYYIALRKELLEKTDGLYTKLSDAVKESLEAPKEAPKAPKAPKAAKAPKAEKAETEAPKPAKKAAPKAAPKAKKAE